MNKNSIFFSITLAFVALFAFITISLLILLHNVHKRENFNSIKRSYEVAHLIHKDLRQKKTVGHETKESLEYMGFKFVKDKKKILHNKHLKLIWAENSRRTSLRRFEFKDRYYLQIQSHNYNILLHDKNERKSIKHYVLIIFAFLFVAFLMLYLNIIKKLKPLSTLQKTVKNIGEENFDIECATDKKDEISQLANEFDKAVKKLKSLKDSRNVFIRNIMHELKTPITKGQFLTQLPNTKENVQSMQKVFYRLESLINEFASIEELISTKKEITKKEYFLSDIVDNASDILMSNETNIVQEFENIKIKVDFQLFSIALKNLMDNGIKYSSNKQVHVKTDGSSIIFENIGERLQHPLQSYYEPFFQSDTKSSQSFGLGLYIVKHILDANGFTLSYEYKDGTNRFILN
jgi:two-component system, OmpR family, sensor kinase